MHNHGKPWTEAENEYLRAHFAAQPVSRTAADLGRSVKSVRNQAQLLGLKSQSLRGGREWRRYPKPQE